MRKLIATGAIRHLERWLRLSILFSLTQGSCAWAGVHSGLLSNDEMALINANAELTRRKFFPEQSIGACWPYDIRIHGKLSGLGYCRTETPGWDGLGAEFKDGPDLLCSYLENSYCDIQASGSVPKP